MTVGFLRSRTKSLVTVIRGRMKLRSDTIQRQTETAMAVGGLSKTYGSGMGAVYAVDDVSFEIEAGSIVGLLGPNGAGKTTLIKSILGLLGPTAGTVYIHGVDVHADATRAYEYVSAMLEGARNIYWRLTPRENVRFFASLQGIDPRERREEHTELLESIGIAVNEPVHDLSRGMKQKTALACTLARETPVVILDEPTQGLDVEASYSLRQRVRRLAEEEGRTVVLSSHNMDTVQEVCDRIIVMNDGYVVADNTVEELVTALRTQAYRVMLRGDISSPIRDSLERSHGIERWDGTADGVRFEVTIDGSKEFYDLINSLQSADAEIASVSAVEPDLEDLFLRLTDREGVPA
jgi:ABC-2 type transport system ATP-binding protein